MDKELKRLKHLQAQRDYNASPKGRKRGRIYNWKFNIKYDPKDKTWDEVFDIFIGTERCERCNIIFPDDDIKYHLHKKHLTKERGILCFTCNHLTKKAINKKNKKLTCPP